MLERHIVIPASPQQLWDALTDPALVGEWFGSDVEWELRPGGPARFREEDGSVRRGMVESVFPCRHLSFRWWPEDDGDNAASRVTYTLDPDEEGTRLTVTEQPVRASASSPLAGLSWTGWDTRIFRCWTMAAAPAPVLPARR